METFFDGLEDVLVPLGICVFLPLMAIWLTIRKKMHAEDIRKEIILAALEKDASIDIEQLVSKMNKPEKLLKEKLLKKLQWGMLAMFLGIGLMGFAIYIYAMHLGGTDHPMNYFLCGLAFFAVGIAFLANYHVGKKMLAKEMEAEEQNLRSQSRTIAGSEEAKHNLRQA